MATRVVCLQSDPIWIEQYVHSMGGGKPGETSGYSTYWLETYMDETLFKCDVPRSKRTTKVDYITP